MALHARSEGLEDVAVQRALIGGFLGQMLADWLGDEGGSAASRGACAAAPGLGSRCGLRGRVRAKREEGGERLLDCEVRAEDHGGRTIAPGTAVVQIDA